MTFIEFAGIITAAANVIALGYLIATLISDIRFERKARAGR